MESRFVAKGLISCENNEKLVFVAGKRGMWNLPGGELEVGETYYDAFIREANEEVERFSSYITEPVECCRVKGIVTPSDNTRKMTYWRVLRASLLVPHNILTIAEGSDITAIAAFTPEECLRHDNMSKLAQKAVILSGLNICA